MAADVFARAALTMARRGGIKATYRHAEGGPPFDVWLVRRLTQGSTGSPGRGRKTTRADFMIPTLCFGPSIAPQRGDLIGVDAAHALPDFSGGWRVEGGEHDPTGAYFLPDLLRQE